MTGLVSGLQARSLSPSEALDRLGNTGFATRAFQPKLLHTINTNSGNAAIYVFESGNGGETLFVSANDAAYPLLGYADSGKFNIKNLPPQLEWWLSEYSAQIAYAEENNLPLTDYSTPQREAVAPLMKTTWNQTSPYDLYTPEVSGNHTPTGCVATAMAQVMKYWNYPAMGTGSVSITLPNGRNDIMNLREKPFDWEQMLDNYVEGSYTDEQAEAVAYLMKACGYVSDMNYSLAGSGAVTMVSAIAFSKNFKYNKSIQYLSRDYFSAVEWEGIVYNEIANHRPILYAGQSTSVGHAFVCDGYDGNGYYHFNWGWGGMSDGYFRLNALSPYSVGTGGGSGGGFNFDQSIVAGVQPDSGEPFVANLSQFGNLKATVKNNVLSLSTSTGKGWFNTGITKIDITFGIEISAAGESEMDPVYVGIESTKVDMPEITKQDGDTYLSYNGLTSCSVAIPSDLPDGRYKVTVVVKDNEGDTPYIPVQTTGGYYNYVYITKSKNTITVENMPEGFMTVADFEMISPLYYGCATKMKITVRNDSEKELTNAFYPILSASGINQMLGEGVVLSVAPGETVTEEFTTFFDLLQGASAPSSRRSYKLQFVNPNEGLYAKGEDGNEWEQNVVMNLNFGTPDVTCSNYDMLGLEWEIVDVPDWGEMPVYNLYNKSVVEFALTVTNNRGFFGYPVYSLIYDSKDTSRNIASVELSPTPVLNVGESADVRGTLDFDEAETDKFYIAVPFAMIGRDLKQLSGEIWAFRMLVSAVDSIEADNQPLSVEVYSLSGQLVSRSTAAPGNLSADNHGNLPAGIHGNLSAGNHGNFPAGNYGNLTAGILENLPAGIYIVKTILTDGTVKTEKIIR